MELTKSSRWWLTLSASRWGLKKKCKQWYVYDRIRKSGDTDDQLKALVNR